MFCFFFSCYPKPFLCPIPNTILLSSSLTSFHAPLVGFHAKIEYMPRRGEQTTIQTSTEDEEPRGRQGNPRNREQTYHIFRTLGKDPSASVHSEWPSRTTTWRSLHFAGQEYGSAVYIDDTDTRIAMPPPREWPTGYTVPDWRASS